jgi:hypothetical protein
MKGSIAAVIAVITLIIFILAALIIAKVIMANTQDISYQGTYKIGSFDVYIYNVYGNLYACPQNITGQQCLIAKNTLVCGDVSCIEIYGIVNVK